MRVVLILALLLIPAVGASAQGGAGVPVPGACIDGVLPSGALSRMCVPQSGWNGDLVVYAHGYVPNLPGTPLDFYNLSLPDGTYLPTLVQSLGFAFATTSYRQNGLVILEGVDDVRELVAEFDTQYGAPRRRFITGVSEGGLVTTLLAERSPGLFTGAYATCGPIGNFRYQINYLGDVRVLFDYFFPGIIPGSVVDVPFGVVAMWESYYVPAISALLAANPSRAIQLMRTANAPYEASDFSTVVATTINALSYNIYATSDAIAKLGGNPYDNRFRWYSGSSNDFQLNRLVQRYAADPAAVATMRAYTSSGDLRIPLVTLHTTKDEIVPYPHELLYLAKVRPSGRGRFLPLPVFRYGHCSFTSTEVLAGLGLLLIQP
jgi:pimeloyl-ACP methyl ester carboxylesterase